MKRTDSKDFRFQMMEAKQVLSLYEFGFDDERHAVVSLQPLNDIERQQLVEFLQDIVCLIDAPLRDAEQLIEEHTSYAFEKHELDFSLGYYYYKASMNARRLIFDARKKMLTKRKELSDAFRMLRANHIYPKVYIGREPRKIGEDTSSSRLFSLYVDPDQEPVCVFTAPSDLLNYQLSLAKQLRNDENHWFTKLRELRLIRDEHHPVQSGMTSRRFSHDWRSLIQRWSCD